MKEIFVKTDDNEQIAFNLFEKGAKSVIVIAPGWFMTKDTKQFRDISDEFAKSYDVICLDFRGHGKSSGKYTFSAKETADLKAVCEFAAEKYKDIYLLGFSLGGTISILYCAQNPIITKLITVSAPCDFQKVENCVWSPRAFIPTLKKWIENEKHKTAPRNIRIASPFLKKTKALDAIVKINLPHLLIAGEKDPTVFVRHTKALYDASNCSRLEIFKDCFHAEDLFYQSHDKFMKLCIEWIEKDA